MNELPAGYWNLRNWYSLSNDMVCCHVQNHETGEELLVNMHIDEAMKSWDIPA